MNKIVEVISNYLYGLENMDEKELRLEQYLIARMPTYFEILHNKTIESFPELGFTNFPEFVSKVNTNEVSLSVDSAVKSEYILFKLIAPKKNVRLFRVYSAYPFLVIFSLCIMAYVQENYYYLLGFILYPLAWLFNSYIFRITAILSLLVSFYFSSTIGQVFAASYFVVSHSFLMSKAIYDEVIKETALKSEKIFLFLLYCDIIDIYKKDNNEIKRLRIND